MNPRQRRGMVLIILAVLGAIAVFAAVSSYVGNVNSQVGSKINVVALKGSRPAYSVIRASDVKSVEIPKRWMDPHAITDPDEVVGHKLAVDASAGSTVTSDLLVPPTDQTQHQRNITIKVDSVTGGATGLRTGDSIDVYAVYADVAGLPKQVRVLVHSVRVISVSAVQNTNNSGNNGGNNSGNQPSSYVAVTVALSGKDSLAMTYASAFAADLRVVKLPPVSKQDPADEKPYDANNLGGKAVPEGTK